MSILIAVPVYRFSCKVGIDRGRAWSAIEEIILWSITRTSKTISALVEEANLPHQLVIASIARLMQFRLVEVAVVDDQVTFRASGYGFKVITSGESLPFFPKRVSRRVSFVIERTSGDFFPTRQVRLMSSHRLDNEAKNGVNVRKIRVEGTGPSISHEANLNRLSEIAAWGWDERLAVVDGRTASMRDDEYMVLRVIDGEPQWMPPSAGQELRRIVSDAAALPIGTTLIPVNYSGPVEEEDSEPTLHSCTFDPSDLVIGGTAQRTCLESLIQKSHRRIIIHSTFLDAKRFSALIDHIRAACLRGVMFDLLWGAEKDDDTAQRNASAALEIAKIVREDKDMKGSFHVHLQATGSHAKLILLDTAEDGWIAGVGSCNWLSSPFNAVECSVVIRNQHAVADVAVALQHLAGRRGLSDNIATEMAILARDLRRAPVASGADKISVVIGDMHNRLIREASSSATRRFIVGSNRLGSTARPGALMQGEVAAERDGVRVAILYTFTAGPLKNRHARALADEAKSHGVTLTKTRKINLHGKFVLWDSDDVIVTSLNWGSASTGSDFPLGEIGVHIRATGIAEHALTLLEEIFPELTEVSGSEIEVPPTN